MKYSEFIFHCAKQGANTYGDATMTYMGFLRGEMAETEVYANCLDRAYFLANQFFQRCSALDKLQCNIKAFYEAGIGQHAPGLVMDEEDRFLKPVAVFQYCDDDKRTDYINLDFHQVGKNVINVLGKWSPYRKIYVQYKTKVPYLGADRIAFIHEDATNYYRVDGVTETFNNFQQAYEAAEAEQLDLGDYGFTNELLMIGVDWVKARLNDDVSMGHSQEIEAESRLNDFESDEFLYVQRRSVM